MKIHLNQSTTMTTHLTADSRSILGLSLKALGLLLLVSVSLIASPIPEQGEITLISGDYQVKLSANSRYNLSGFVYKGKDFASGSGLFGLTVSMSENAFAGSGHNEAGSEQISSLSLTVDGKQEPIEIGKDYQGKNVEVVKTSKIGGMEIDSTIRLSDDGVTEKRQFRIKDDMTIKFLYVFMYPWKKNHDKWCGGQESGKILSGDFLEAEPDEFVMRADVRWTGVFDSSTGLGVVASFGKTYAGRGVQSAYWNRAIYKKFYFMPNVPQELPSGFESEVYEVTLRGFESAGGEAWTEDADRAAMGK